MNIYIMRHGETEWNKTGLIQGRTDNPLNQLGLEQAEQLAEELKNKSPSLVISSSLKRASETLEVVYKKLNLECDKIIDDDFTERNFGEFEGKPGSEYNQATDLSIFPNFENTKTLQKRAISGLLKYQNYDTVFIFSHSHLIKAIVTFLDKNSTFKNLHLPNCAMVKLTITDSQITLKYIK